MVKSKLAGPPALPPGLLKRLAENAQGRDLSDRLFIVQLDMIRVFYKDLERAGILKHAPGGKLDFHALRITYVNLVLESGASVKEAMDLARHQSPNMTLNVYGRSRWDWRAALVERIEETVSPENRSENTQRIPQPKIAVMGKPMDSRDYMEPRAGVEPATC